jgi:hypothetical protein
MKRWLPLLLLSALAFAQSPYVTVTGIVQGPNGLPVANNVITFTPTQNFFVAGSGGGGGGNCPGGLSGTLQGNQSGVCNGVPGSSINFTTGSIAISDTFGDITSLWNNGNGIELQDATGASTFIRSPGNGGLIFSTPSYEALIFGTMSVQDFGSEFILKPQSGNYNGGAGVALQVTGDNHSSDIQDWYAYGVAQPKVSISSAGVLTLPMTGTSCLGEISGVVTATGSPCVGGGNPTLDNCTTDQSGNSFPAVLSLTNWFDAHWEFVYNTTTYINCTVYIPSAQSGATFVIDVYSADSTSGHTANIQTCDTNVPVSSSTFQVGALTCASTQTFTTSSTAYSRSTLNFAVQSTLTNGGILVVKIGTSPTGTAPTSDILIYPHFVL